MIGLVGLWQAVYVVFGFVGLYLAYVGWKPVRPVGHTGEVQIRVEFPDAA